MSKILVIDDDVDLADLTRRRLQRMGLTAKVHAGSRGAMDLLRRLTELHGADSYLSKSATSQEFEFRIRDLLRSGAGANSGRPGT